jgi:hypothetical protein
MKLCIEGDIYFLPKFHILETGTVKLSIETGLGPATTPDTLARALFFTAMSWTLRPPARPFALCRILSVECRLLLIAPLRLCRLLLIALPLLSHARAASVEIDVLIRLKRQTYFLVLCPDD